MFDELLCFSYNVRAHGFASDLISKSVNYAWIFFSLLFQHNNNNKKWFSMNLIAQHFQRAFEWITHTPHATRNTPFDSIVSSICIWWRSFCKQKMKSIPNTFFQWLIDCHLFTPIYSATANFAKCNTLVRHWISHDRCAWPNGIACRIHQRNPCRWHNA